MLNIFIDAAFFLKQKFLVIWTRSKWQLQQSCCSGQSKWLHFYLYGPAETTRSSTSVTFFSSSHTFSLSFPHHTDYQISINWTFFKIFFWVSISQNHARQVICFFFFLCFTNKLFEVQTFMKIMTLILSNQW